MEAALDRPPVIARPAAEMEALQRELNAAVQNLELAAQERRNSGCVAAGLAGGSFVFILFLWLSPVYPLIGMVVLTGALAGIGLALRLATRKSAALAKGRDRIIELGQGLCGDEELSLDAKSRTRVHDVLRTAGPDEAIAILRVLATAGDRRSLWLARFMSGSRGYTAEFTSCRDPRVREEAVRTVRRIEARMELARRSSTLLRPSQVGAKSELLRPATNTPIDEPAVLLRLQADDLDGNESTDGLA